MIKRLRWIIIGYILGIFTFDIAKRFLDERYGETKVYQTFTTALVSVSDFRANKDNLDNYIDED